LFYEKNIAENWLYFVNILCNILVVVWQVFVIVWQNTPCTVCHPAMAWLAYRIGVVEQCCQMVKYNTIFLKMV